MFRVIIKRILVTIPTLIGVTLIAALMLHFIPGDPAEVIGGERASKELLDEIRRNLGLDRAFTVQYFIFLKRLLSLDLGRSYISGQSVTEALIEKLPNTIVLALAAILFATVTGVLSGTIGALYRGKWPDRLLQSIVAVGISIPVFYLGLLLMFFLAVWYPLLPPSGFTGWRSLLSGEGWKYLILPMITLGTQSACYIARITRSSILDVLPQDFVRTARAKGLSGRRIFFKHILLNALIPIITVISLDLGSYLSGSVITETVFSWPGIGRYIYDSIRMRDFPVIQGMVLFCALVFIMANLITDVLYAVLDPRVRDEASK